MTSDLPPNPYYDADPSPAFNHRRPVFCYRCDKWVKDAAAHAIKHADEALAKRARKPS